MLGLLLSSLFVGCADYTMTGIKIREAEVLVYPMHLDFGHLISGQESEQDYFTITNTGDDDLIISSPVLVSGNDRFDLLSVHEDTITIPGGEMITVEVGYVPETFESNGGYVEIATNDEDEGYVIVTLEGYGDAPVMTVSPDEFDYGDISIGCDNEERVTITNDGNMPLVIDSVTQMVTQPQDIVMEYGSLPDPPWELEPGYSVDFLVSYLPNDVGYDESNIRIEGNDPATPAVEVTQYGDGDVEQWYTQTWIQEEIPVLDILWVIDNSGSMNRFQTNLSLNIGSFMGAFIATGADYNMAVITTDDPSFTTIIKPTSPDPESQLASLVMMGIYGSGIEKGIEMVSNSLSDPAAAGPGGLFFRESSKLVVIFVSDEPDQSAAGWSSYISFFDGLKSPGDFIPYGVIGDHPSGCSISSPFGNAQYGAGYWDLIDHYGGEWYSICASDWGVQLQDLAGEVTGRRSFWLDEPDPMVDTIEVRVNGQLSTDWEYDESRNAIVFAEDHVPREGQTVDISYATWGCEGR